MIRATVRHYQKRKPAGLPPSDHEPLRLGYGVRVNRVVLVKMRFATGQWQVRCDCGGLFNADPKALLDRKVVQCMTCDSEAKSVAEAIEGMKDGNRTEIDAEAFDTDRPG